MNAQTMFKRMHGDSPRLPKPWEPAFKEYQQFTEWAASIPETTPVSLWPLMWPVHTELKYQDGGGLNALLKEHQGLSKKAWKAIASMSVEDTIALYDHHRRLGLRRWVMDLPRAMDSLRESSVEPTAASIIVLMGLRLDLENMPDPYYTDRIGFIRLLGRHLQQESPADLDAFRADMQLVLDFLDEEGYAFTEATTVAELQAAAQTWHQELMQVGPVEVNTERHDWRAAPTPGGRDVFHDTATGLDVVRLQQFTEFQQESELMQHCIGLSDNYHRKHRDGSGAFYSLRREGARRPVATLELVCYNDEWRIAQCRGFANGDPGPEANDLAQRLLEGHRSGLVKTSAYEFVHDGDQQPMHLSNTSTRHF